MADTDDARAVGENFLRFVKKGEIDDFDAFTPDFIYWNPNGVPFDLASTSGTVKSFFSALGDHESTIEDTIAEGNKVMYRWTTRGHHTGVLRGLEPTGKAVTIIGVTIMRTENGKIAELWDYVDIFGMLQQLGVLPD